MKYLIKKTKASSLNYTILLFILITSLVSTIIYFNYYLKLQQLSRLQKLETINNCQSGLNYLFATRNQPDINRFDSVLNLGSGQDSIKVRSFPWGGYNILYSSVRKKNFMIERIAMTANYRFSDSSSTLVLKDNDHPLCLCLNSIVNGKVFVPQAKIKYELMNGQAFSGLRIERMLIRESEDSLPRLNRYFAQISINSLIESTSGKPGNENESNNLMTGDTLERSFKESTIVVYDKILMLDQIVAKGNIVFVSDSLVFVSKHCDLDGVIIIGKEIVIEEGFEGIVQCFAKNKILVESKVILKYPSGLFLIPDNLQKDSTNQPNGIKSITIKENAYVSGIIFTNYIYDIPHSYELSMNIEKNSIVKGLVYWTGSIQLKGEVSGQLFVNSFHIKNAFGYYDNYIADGIVSKDTINYNRWFPSLFKNKNNGEVVKWLN